MFIPIVLKKKQRLEEAKYLFLGQTSGTNIKIGLRVLQWVFLDVELVWVREVM